MATRSFIQTAEKYVRLFNNGFDLDGSSLGGGLRYPQRRFPVPFGSVTSISVAARQPKSTELLIAVPNNKYKIHACRYRVFSIHIIS